MKHDYDNDGMSGPAECAPEPIHLELGTIVDYAGLRGTVFEIEPEPEFTDYPVKIKLHAGSRDYILFVTRDGKTFKEQKYSLLTVIGKKKMPIKKWQWLYVDEHELWQTTGLMTESDAQELYRGYALTKLTESEKVLL